MNRFILLSFLLLLSVSLYADLVGNKPRPESSVFVRGVQQLPKDWVLICESDITHQTKLIRRDTMLMLRGGYGRPDGISIWAKNIKTGKQTAPINYYNRSESQALKILTVRNDSLILDVNNPNAKEKSDKKNKTKKLKKNGFLLFDDSDNDGKEPVGMMVVVSAVSLGLLGWMYMRRKNALKKSI